MRIVAPIASSFVTTARQAAVRDLMKIHLSMRLPCTHIAKRVALATMLLLAAARAQAVELESNFDKVLGVQPANAWGMESFGTEPAQLTPPIPPQGTEIPPEATGRVTPPCRPWCPGAYGGRGTEFTREFCFCYADDWCPPRLDPSPRYSVYLWQGFDTFRSIPDFNESETGILQGVNLGMPVPLLEDHGIGFQIGASYAAYNLGGSFDRTVPTASPTQQEFVTIGFFRRCSANRPFSFGIVYDWMINQNYGSFSQPPTLGQGRAQLAYAVTARNEIGIMGAWNCQNVWLNAADGPVFYRPVNQGNIFWHHRYLWRNLDSFFWVGLTDAFRANGDNSMGKMVVGLTFELPVTDRLAVYFRGQHWDTTTAGASLRDVYDLSVGLMFYPSRTARSSTVAGRIWTPLLPVANNANFMSDTDRVQ
jgi:hypothetical protein